MSSLANSQSIVAVQLPSLFPDVAWIRNLMSSNLLVIQDHLVFSRKSRVHRGKIRTPDGTQWIHIPIHPEDRNLPLYLCRIDHQTDWMTPLWRSLEYNYRNSIYFDFYEPEILGIFQEVKKMKLFSEIHEFLYQTWLTL